jgi:hypothetical protein
MTLVLAWIIMEPAQKDAAVLLDDEEAALGPNQIDNPLANNLGHGTLVGKWVVAARILNDVLYERWYPTLGTYPIAVMDGDTLFIPPVID